MRGGRVLFQNIQAPKPDDWTTVLDATEASFNLEKNVHESLLALHKNAGDQQDAQLTDFIEGEYLKDQVNLTLELKNMHLVFIRVVIELAIIHFVLILKVETQKKLGDLITKLRRAGQSITLHIIDKELQ